MNRRKQQQGVTLVELIIVLTLVAIIGSVTPVVMRQNTQQRELTAFAKELQADALYAKNYAYYRQTRVYIRIFPQEAEYRIYEKSSQPLIVKPIPTTVCIPQSQATFVHYTAQGTISQGNTIYLAQPDACQQHAQTTQKLVATLGNSVYYHVM